MAIYWINLFWIQGKKLSIPITEGALITIFSKYDETVIKGKEQYKDLELAKRRASNLKHKAIEKMDRYLTEFETNFTKRGGKVIWAISERDARKEILNIVKRSNAKVIVKQKTMLSEELEINETPSEK